MKRTISIILTCLLLITAVPMATVNASDHPFTDVAPGRWYTGAVRWAFENNVMLGMSPTRFEPSGRVLVDKLCNIV